MKSLAERKLRLISQISHLKKEVDKLIQSPERNRIYPQAPGKLERYRP